MLFNRRKKIIEKSIKMTLETLTDKTPKVFENFFYGAYDIGPENLVIWYLFETDAEFKTAQENGLCNYLVETTINNMKSLGYPAEAFDSSNGNNTSETIKIEWTNEQVKEQILNLLNNRKVYVSFTTKEDIDKKVHGDYHLYFQ